MDGKNDSSTCNGNPRTGVRTASARTCARDISKATADYFQKLQLAVNEQILRQELTLMQPKYQYELVCGHRAILSMLDNIRRSSSTWQVPGRARAGNLT